LPDEGRVAVGVGEDHDKAVEPEEVGERLVGDRHRPVFRRVRDRVGGDRRDVLAGRGKREQQQREQGGNGSHASSGHNRYRTCGGPCEVPGPRPPRTEVRMSAVEWRKLAERELKGRDPDSLTWATPEGIAVKPVYGPEDLAGLPQLGTMPGEAPFTRG